MNSEKSLGAHINYEQTTLKVLDFSLSCAIWLQTIRHQPRWHRQRRDNVASLWVPSSAYIGLLDLSQRWPAALGEVLG